jgi:hypothetical protein
MHYLKNFDLSNVDVNGAPHTDALADQKHDSMSSLEHFWFQCLTEGRLVNCEFVEKWEPRVGKADFRRALTAYCKERNIKSWTPSDITLARELRKMTPTLCTDQKVLQNGVYNRAFQFSDLETCRAEWNKRMGFERKWE